MVPLSIVGDVLRHWVLFTVGVLSVVAASSLLGWLMTRLQMLPGTTALWGTSPGAASVMTIMAEHYGADIRLVALMQYLRVVMVAAVAALVAQAVRRQLLPCAPHAIVWFPPGRLAAARRDAGARHPGTADRALAAHSRRRLPGAAGAGIVLTHFGLMTIELPTWLLAASYALVGWNVGLRFTRPLLIHAARALPRILGCTLRADRAVRRRRGDRGLWPASIR